MRCQVNNCCFCIPLGDSVLIIGYLKLFLGLTIFVLGSALLSFANSLNDAPPDGPLHMHFHWIYGSVLSVTIMAQGMLVTASSLLLIVGGHKRKSLPLRSYPWISIAVLVMEATYLMVVFIDLHSYQMWTLVFLTCTAIEIYFMIVIRSVYVEMNIEQATSRHGHNIENPLTA